MPKITKKDEIVTERIDGKGKEPKYEPSKKMLQDDAERIRKLLESKSDDKK